MMAYRFINKIWNDLLIAFDANYTVEGFERTQKQFELPENLRQLDPKLKRILTICNLFANQKHSIWSIARVLDVSLGFVVSTLIEQGLIKERRKGTSKWLRNERRQQSPYCITKKPEQLSYIVSPAVSELKSFEALVSPREAEKPFKAELSGRGGEDSVTQSPQTGFTAISPDNVN